MDTLQERRQNFADAMDFKSPKKIPVDLELNGWPLAYGGKTLHDALVDPEATGEAYCKFMDDIPYDVSIYDWGYVLLPEIYNILGCNLYVMGDDGVFTIHNQGNVSYVPDEDYDELIHDFDHYLHEKRVRQLYGVYSLPKTEAYEKVREAAIKTRNFMQFDEKINQILEERGKFRAVDFYGGCPYFLAPISLISNDIRGLKNTLIDLRRHPEQLDELCAVVAETTPPYNPNWADGLPYRLGWTCYQIECFLSNKQFEKYFWKPFCRDFKPLMEQGVKFLLKGEGYFKNTLEYYMDLPDHSMVFMLDQDDPFEVYNIIGEKHTLIAGASVDMLQCATKEQCVDYAQRCFDTFAPGGGFIFGNNKPLLGARDAKVDNIRAVYEFAEKYSRQ